MGRIERPQLAREKRRGGKNLPRRARRRGKRRPGADALDR
jgi:hypothetical protein